MQKFDNSEPLFIEFVFYLMLAIQCSKENALTILLIPNFVNEFILSNR